MSTRICWFRKGLRIHDNPSLSKSTIPHDFLLPILILAPSQLSDISDSRCVFYLESIADLNKSLETKYASKLCVFRGDFRAVFQKLFSNLSVTEVCLEADYEENAVACQNQLVELASEYGVKVTLNHSHVNFNPHEVIQANHGKAPLTMTSFLNVLKKVKRTGVSIPAPSSLLPLPTLPDPLLEDYINLSCPSMEEMVRAIPLGTRIHTGGESVALERFEKFLKDKKRVLEFEKPKTTPASFSPDDEFSHTGFSTTVLSPYITHGSLSSRLFMKKLDEICEGKKHTQPPVSLHGQLYWREFYYTAGTGTPNFHKMVGNPICLQVNWRDDKVAEDYLKKWQNAQTGYPWIDAIMIQLNTQGYIHHLARHSVACFLTRGDLYVTWEKGAEYFEKVLLDADYFLNTGNWLWLSASAFFSQYFRVYSPVVFGKGFDKNGNYIRHFLPVLKDMPAQYIYEPWKAPLEVQRKANCIVGKDYPNRVVIHEEVSKTNMAKMKAAYDARKEGKSMKADVKEKPVSAVSKKRSQSPKTAPITKFFKKG